MLSLITLLCALSLAFSSSPEENPGLFEGDIILSAPQKYAIDHNLGPAAFGASKTRRWIGGVVPYTYARSINFSSRAVQTIQSAMKEWSTKTCIRFVRRTNQAQHVEFYKGGGCSSYVGMTGRGQKISLATGCWRHGIVAHEIGHALGFWHEQSRPDRDKYVTILWRNINSKMRFNFYKHSISQVDSLGESYDYDSVMHYGSQAFSANGGNTIVPKRPGVQIGNRQGLSVSDVKQMNRMYSCKTGPTRPTRLTNPPPGSKKVEIRLRSEGCQDPKYDSRHKCGQGYIIVNGKHLSKKRLGINMVILDYQTGVNEGSFSYNTYRDEQHSTSLTKKLNSYVSRRLRKIVVIAVQGEAYKRLSSAAKSILGKIGVSEPKFGYMGSYALIGYTGSDRPSWVAQMERTRKKGPSVLRKTISLGSIGPGPVPPTEPPISTRPPVVTKPPSGSCGVSGAFNRVIGGTNAAPGAWPWQVGLLMSGRFGCGGSLIAADWVVTAAHCIRSKVGSSYTILLGAHNRNSPERHEQRIRGRRVIVHPNYNNPRLSSDIALIQLERPAKMSSRVSTVCLPEQNYDVSLSSECYITGWGKIRHPGSSHHTLQQAKLLPVSQQECHRKHTSSGSHGIRITEQMLCAGVKDSRLGGCHGDSGGPFVCRDSSNRFVLQGAVSWGSTTCNAYEKYSVFARVAKFRNWIDQEMRRAQG